MKEIELTHGLVALVDDEDYKYLNQWNWHASRTKYTFYARRNLKSGEVHSTKRMHREIFEHISGELGHLIIDHINGDGLDNRRSNLRIADHRKNEWNSRKKPAKVNKHHPYKGITFARGHWCAQIKVGDRHIHCGYYPTPGEAAAAYDEAAVKYFGDFARTNAHLPEAVDTVTAVAPVRAPPKKRKGTTSIYKGVSYQTDRNKWVAYIDIPGKRIVCGRYSTQNDAAQAYNNAALIYLGKNAKLNKICDAQDD
jgi:hypothetical protein